MRPKLSFPCPERWENMRVGVIGRHCSQCDKEVVDHTGISKEDLVRYLLSNKGRSVCGRVRPDQIDAYHEFVEVCIWRSLKAKRSSNLAFYLIAMSGISAAGCGSPSVTDQYRQTPHESGADTTGSGNDVTMAGSATHTQEMKTSSGTTIDPVLVVGELIIDDTVTHNAHDQHQLPEVMPEFPGGQDSLYAFVRQHLVYPEWEHENKIEGRVFVEFVIDRNGDVTMPQIVRSVHGSKNFDAEVLKVIGLMPVWEPGKNGEEVVATKLVLPISFKL